MGSTKPPSLSVGSVYSWKKKVQRRERISRSSKVPSHWSGLRMNTASPTILRTRHKFGDYLSQPDLAKFELPKKMSRPWIVNNAFEQEKLKDLIVTETPVEASLVMRQIKESKQERKKQPGYNKKHVRNINDIIEKDQKTVKESKKKQSTKEHVEKKRKHMLKKQVGVGSATQDDATAALSSNVVAKDHVTGNKEDTQPVYTDIELEQQRMMNRVFNCPNLYSAAGPFTTMVQMVPVMVPNHQTGGYFVVHLPVQPLPEHVAQPQHVFHPQPSDSPFSSSSSSSSTCSSTSPPASDDGFFDGSDLESETSSLVEMVDDIKLDVSLDSSMELTDEESDYEILDEDLERVVRSIIDEDDE